MNPASETVVVLLAAGRSSRMGTTKPLLPLGSTTVIERLVDSVSRAPVGEIVVVTGHNLEKIAPVLDRLPVRQAHNAGYEAGMFSSVRVGVGALRPGADAFFILPADYPLVGPEVLDRLIDRFRQGWPAILHPTCCGLRGHPPLISGRYREALLEASGEDDLRSFLCRHRECEAEVEVEDLTVLMDMDTAEDYGRIVRFAGILDGGAGPAGAERGAAGAPFDAAAGGTGRPARAGGPALSSEDALYLLSLLEAPEDVVRHCRAVAVVGEALAEALKPRMPDLDVDLVRCACLLHDLARARPKHAVVGQSVLANLGLFRLGEIVGAHMVMPPDKLAGPVVTEEQLVYLADKLVVGDEVAGLEERAARASREGGHDPAALEGVRTRMRTALVIRERVESALGNQLEEVVPRERYSSI
jgi:molybdenum cofactor cytidylyltransferase